jgi:hypothetical protein
MKPFFLLMSFFIGISAFANPEILTDQEYAERYRAANDGGVLFDAPSDAKNRITYMGIQDFGDGNLKFIFRLRNSNSDDPNIEVDFNNGQTDLSFNVPKGQEVWFTVPAVMTGNLTANAFGSTATADLTSEEGKLVNIPIDGGLGLLLLGGLGFGIYRQRSSVAKSS